MAERKAKTKKKVNVEEKPMDYSVISLMKTDSPVAVYKKKIVARLDVRVLNSFTGRIESVTLEGNPNNDNERGNFVELWSDKEHAFFKRANTYHLEEGYLIPFKKPRSIEPRKSVNNLPDNEIEELVVSKFFAMKKVVDQMTSEAALIRVISEAEKVERPEKTMEYLRGRLSLIQSGELEDAS